ncbi:PREDICTED: interleukin-22 receptor subunit alpha-1 [Elephantulus edwardii]|uniref:interleukin-22 receptor subunit alpha-1 n=1 Tax=Elephantulus edwardii TaxID=28737 RepID=UPI0003F0A864|nr:PREDICTED: interleukin-22 receptor subunit alpha-1 [Elephantulus edwardii]
MGWSRLPRRQSFPGRVHRTWPEWRLRRYSMLSPVRTLLTILAVGSLADRIAEDTSNLLQYVKFQSSNFENILTWDSGPESTQDTIYSVKYKKYGESTWLEKKDCQQITQKSCNLTTELERFNEPYYAQVTAKTPGGKSASRISHRFSLPQDTTIKPPDVTCIPKVRSIQMIIHPTLIPRYANSQQLTLKDIFDDLLYHLELQVNHSYKIHLEGTQREYEFPGLSPDTEFLGNIMISVPRWSKESAPYVCRVRTLPDLTWTYSFSGTILFAMGFLVAAVCYLSYRYITKPPQPPDSLNVQRVLTFQPLQFIQEHVLIPSLDLRSSSRRAQNVHYSRVKVAGPREPLEIPRLHDSPEIAYMGQSDISILQPRNVPPQQTCPPPSYAPQIIPKTRPASYAPQATPKAEPPSYSPQTISKIPPPSYAPQSTQDSWLPSYGVFMESSEKDSPSVSLSSPKHLRIKSQLQKEVLARSHILDGLSLQPLTSLTMEEPQEAKSHNQYLGFPTDTESDLNEETELSGYLKGQLPLLSSVQIEGHPVSLRLHTPSPPCSPSAEDLNHCSLLESLVCAKDEGPISKTETEDTGARTPSMEQQVEVNSLFRVMALTVQWEA